MEKIQGYTPVLQSGAAHDASEIASVWPMAKIFMRCAGGKSHCPEESVRQDDVRWGIEFLLDLLCSNYQTIIFRDLSSIMPFLDTAFFRVPEIRLGPDGGEEVIVT